MELAWDLWIFEESAAQAQGSHHSCEVGGSRGKVRSMSQGWKGYGRASKSGGAGSRNHRQVGAGVCVKPLARFMETQIRCLPGPAGWVGGGLNKGAMVSDSPGPHPASPLVLCERLNRPTLELGEPVTASLSWALTTAPRYLAALGLSRM